MALLAVTAKIAGRLSAAVLRIGWLGLRKSARAALRDPLPAAVSATAIAGAVLVLWWLVRTPPVGYGDYDKSLACMAQNVYHEARGEPVAAQIAVAKVVLNRVRHRRFPNTVCAVIKQGGEWPHHGCQFSWWCDGRTDAISDQQAMSTIMTLARDVLLGYHDDPTDGALWYHTSNIAPDWRSDFEAGPTIGKHIFYRPR